MDQSLYSAHIAMRSKDQGIHAIIKNVNTSESFVCKKDEDPQVQPYAGWIKGGDYGWAKLDDFVTSRPAEHKKDKKTYWNYDAKTGPPHPGYFTPVRAITTKVSRHYGGINSSGGPQASGRADHTDMVVEKNIDDLSPYLFQYCCSGVQFEYVHIVVIPTKDNFFERLHIILKDVSVTSHEFVTTRKTGYKDRDAVDKDGTVVGVDRTSLHYDSAQIEKFTLLYTAIRFESLRKINNDWESQSCRGWDTGVESEWT